MLELEGIAHPAECVCVSAVQMVGGEMRELGPC